MMDDRQYFPVVAIIPSLNPDEKLLGTVNGLFQSGFTSAIVVDDGSRQECQPIFDQISQIHGCTVLHHEVNRGKGRALKTAFSYYLECFDQKAYIGVVTADADGQHLPEDIYRTANTICLAGKETDKDACVHPEKTMALGSRNFDEEQVPFKSRNGNKITTAVFQVLYGKRVGDTQTGLRAIPNLFLPKCLQIRGERFEYEIDMLIEAVREKLDIIEVPIQTVYFDNNRETHFHPVKDSIKIYRVMLSSFLRFTCSGLISMLIDQGLFAILAKVLLGRWGATHAIFVATAIARAVSSYINFSLNRTIVFGAGKNRKFLLRYYLLCALQMAASAAGVAFFYQLTTGNTTVLKLVVDTLLFLLSYQIQQKWVFNLRR